MKTEAQIKEARIKVAKTIVDNKKSISDHQLTLLTGILNALA